LNDELTDLIGWWPPDAGRIVRVIYSPPDWDDRPRSVAVAGRRRIKTGNFPHDDTHRLTLSLLGGQRRVITVIPPDSDQADASRVLHSFGRQTPPGDVRLEV